MFEVNIEVLTFETEKNVDNLKEARARFEKYKNEYYIPNFAERKEFPTKEKALSYIKKFVRTTTAHPRINSELAEVKIFEDFSYLKFFKRSFTADKAITPAQWQHFLEGKRTLLETICIFTINEIKRIPCKMID